MENNNKNNETITISLKEYESLKKGYKFLKERCSELENQLKWFIEQLKINNKKTFGSKSEQMEYQTAQKVNRKINMHKNQIVQIFKRPVF